MPTAKNARKPTAALMKPVQPDDTLSQDRRIEAASTRQKIMVFDHNRLYRGPVPHDGGNPRGPPTALMNSVHEGDKKVCRKKDQMDRPLHQVSATCAKSDGAHQERYHEHSDVLRLQPQY